MMMVAHNLSYRPKKALRMAFLDLLNVDAKKSLYDCHFISLMKNVQTHIHTHTQERRRTWLVKCRIDFPQKPRWKIPQENSTKISHSHHVQAAKRQNETVREDFSHPLQQFEWKKSKNKSRKNTLPHRDWHWNLRRKKVEQGGGVRKAKSCHQTIHHVCFMAANTKKEST